LRLLEEVCRGDLEALGQLLDRYRPDLQAFVDCHLNPAIRARVDPSDVVQEAQMEVARRMGDYLKRRPMPFHLWVRRTAYERLLNLRRDHRRARRHTGRAHQVVGDYEQAQKAFREAIAVFERLARDFPDDLTYPHELVTTWRILAEDLYRAGSLRDANACMSRALSVFREAVRNHPADAESACQLAYFDCCWLDPQRREPAEAVAMARRAIELAPHSPRPFGPGDDQERVPLRVCPNRHLIPGNRIRPCWRHRPSPAPSSTPTARRWRGRSGRWWTAWSTPSTTR
jgi:DNA-directed RNA polymerase specialized sigma24 family protein